jgi:hypothetical protein
MLDWLGAPTWHFARSILNTTLPLRQAMALIVERMEYRR